MKKMKFAALLLPIMLFGSLVGCDSNSKQYDEFCAKAADAAPLLLNSATGKEIYASEKTRYLSDYSSVLALKKFSFQEKDIAISWSLTPQEKWVSSPYVMDATRNKIIPVYSKEAFDASLKATVSVVEDGKKLGKAELSWKFHVEAVDTIEMTLKQINEKFIENEYKLTGLAGKDEEDKDIIIGTRGIVTGTFDKSTNSHLGSGVFIQDGEYGMQLFSTKVLADLYKESGANVGDCVFVVGKLSLYNGFMEMEPSLIDVVGAEAYNIAAPVTMDLSTKTFDKTLKVNASTLVTFPGCVYKDGNVSSETAHASINFTHGDDKVLVYCNYHLGPTAMNAIKDLVGTFIADQTTVTIKGLLTFYNDDPQIVPIQGVASFDSPAPVQEAPAAAE